jgi:hypothetical protein
MGCYGRRASRIDEERTQLMSTSKRQMNRIAPAFMARRGVLTSRSPLVLAP